MLVTTSLSIALALGAAANPDAADLEPALEGIQAGLVHAERTLTVIAIERPADAPAPSVHVADVSAPRITVAPRGAGRPDRLFATSDAERPPVLVPGHIVENGERSFALTSYARASQRGVELDLALVAGDSEKDEARLALRVLPPTLRWMALTQPNSGEIRESVLLWTRRWRTPDGEDTLSDLRRAKGMDARVAEYLARIAPLRPSAPGRVIVGYAALIDGEVAALEVFGSAADFARHWPSTAHALAIEAVLAERNTDWLPATIHADATPAFGPDRVNSMLADLIAQPLEGERLDHALTLRSAGDQHQATRVLTTADGDLVHLLHTPDATARLAPKFDSAEPADARTKGRSTGDVERLGDRRGDTPALE